MNKPAKIKPTYVGACSVLDRAEFARLIRANKGLLVYLVKRDSEPKLPGLSGAVFLRASATEAIEKLNYGDLDAFAWGFSDSGQPNVWQELAPLHVQAQRRRETLAREIAEEDRHIASLEKMPIDTDCRAPGLLRASARQSARRAELTRLAAQPVNVAA